MVGWLLAGMCVAAERPNIVFLFADDQCTYSVGCYGNKDVQTPNMDRLAADGVLFTNAFVTTAICCSNRACILTGRYPFRTFVGRWIRHLNNSEPIELTEDHLVVLRSVDREPAGEMPLDIVRDEVAEKVHAYTRPRATGEGSRVKDLVDILLIAELRQMDGPLLQQALQAPG